MTQLATRHSRPTSDHGTPSAVERHRSSQTPSTPRVGTPGSIGSQLDDEWRLLHLDPRSLRRAHRWNIIDGPLDDLDQIVCAAGARRAATADSEAIMRSLLGLASQGDQLAGRVVLQRVLPGLVKESTRWRATRSRTISAALDDIIGAAWIAIRSFNPQRSPSCYAAAIIGEAAERTFRNRTASADEIVQEPEQFERTFSVAHEPNALEEVAELVATARDAGMAECDLELLRDLVRIGSPGRVARERAVTPRTIRNHRDRITRDLRQIALAA